MNYTYQLVTESGSFAPPQGKDVEHATNQHQLARALERWQDDHDRVGEDCALASLLVWRGILEDVTDIYPDYEAKFGPRGGFILSPC